MKQKTFWRGKHGPLLIAEIGGNHEGNFSYAKKLTKLAISTGVDVIKFQIYSGSGLVSRVESKKRFEHFKSNAKFLKSRWTNFDNFIFFEQEIRESLI